VPTDLGVRSNAFRQFRPRSRTAGFFTMKCKVADVGASTLSCSFCYKSEDSVSKLVSGPREPRVYVCDECIAVCAVILKDDLDRHLTHSGTPVTGGEGHPHLTSRLASSLLTAVERWIRRESLGDDAARELAELRKLAVEMIQDQNRGSLGS
jgi:hypothetical protein